MFEALKPCFIEAWLHFNFYRMSLVNFKPKKNSLASRGFLAAARLSCFILSSAFHEAMTQNYAQYL